MKISPEKIGHAMPGEHLGRIRCLLGLTQAQLAALLGISSPAVIGDYEHGRRRVPDYTARHLLLLLRLAEWEKMGRECKRHVAGDDDLSVRLVQLLRTSPLLTARGKA